MLTLSTPLGSLQGREGRLGGVRVGAVDPSPRAHAAAADPALARAAAPPAPASRQAGARLSLPPPALRTNAFIGESSYPC